MQVLFLPVTKSP